MDRVPPHSLLFFSFPSLHFPALIARPLGIFINRRVARASLADTVANMSSSSSSTDTSNAASSVSALVSTLAPVALYALIYLGVFLLIRNKFPRYYYPRSFLRTLPEENQSPKLKKSMFGWFGQFWKINDEYVLNHHTLDGYLFLRFLKMSVVICFVGCLITWPVLFPINATGGGGNQGLDILTMANCTNNYYKYFAHAGCAIIFFVFLLWVITRESIYYINIRQAYLMSPLYASRISSRTVLYTSVPQDYMNEEVLRSVLGSGVRNIWLATDCKELSDKVDERDSAALKLEGAETSLLKTANGKRLKEEKKRAKLAKKKGGDAAEAAADGAAAERGETYADRYVSPKDRPTHRLKFLIGKKVDTIDWCRAELQKLIPEVEAMQAKHRAGDAKLLNSVFVEFETLVQAQEAFQSLTHHKALQMSPRFSGMTPTEVIWTNLNISWWQRVVRNILVLGFITALIIFWAIPVAAVGAISNVTYLIEKLPWLGFINNLPDKLHGIITGLLPVILLAVLFALVPIIMRLMAKIAGAPTRGAVELTVQGWYFAFLVVQGFLVVTIASAASAVVAQIVKQPQMALTLLSSNLPKASNFYINYFILQGLGVFSGILLSIVGLLIFLVLSKLLDKTPRKMYNRWINLAGIGWGTLFPNMELLIVIAICYVVIAPLVLGFATLGLFFLYLAYRYNILFVSDANVDCKGRLYTNALQHLFVGIYLSQVCLIALFAIATGKSVGALGPLILMIIMLVVTVLYQISLNSALAPMLEYLPKSLAAEEARLQALENGSNNGVAQKEAAAASLDGPQPKTKKPGNILTRFLRPDKYSDYAAMRKLVPTTIAINYSDEVARDAYYDPAITSEVPLLWIPRDPLGLSHRAVQETGKVLPITDEGAHIDAETNSIEWDGRSFVKEGSKEKQEDEADAHAEARPPPKVPIAEEKIYY